MVARLGTARHTATFAGPRATTVVIISLSGTIGGIAKARIGTVRDGFNWQNLVPKNMRMKILCLNILPNMFQSA